MQTLELERMKSNVQSRRITSEVSVRGQLPYIALRRQ